ncbi:hypothetical protein CEXT_35751 [Caerostris extrusa]|uniref:Uncharacterized protein n=1 Tax=Caerostris extrusa TaxID=172846 RepID=A0AAV4NZ48_CAEEX|nr:hypothetical protein CEXT_35751 [Caerostris extrusa]
MRVIEKCNYEDGPPNQLLGLDRQGHSGISENATPLLNTPGDRLEDPAHHAMTAADLLRGALKVSLSAQQRQGDWITLQFAEHYPSPSPLGDGGGSEEKTHFRQSHAGKAG